MHLLQLPAAPAWQGGLARLYSHLMADSANSVSSLTLCSRRLFGRRGSWNSCRLRAPCLPRCTEAQEQLRDTPLCELTQPLLFVRGTRDAFSKDAQFDGVRARLASSRVEVHKCIQPHMPACASHCHGLALSMLAGSRRAASYRCAARRARGACPATHTACCCDD